MRESEEEFLAAIEAAGIALPDGPMSLSSIFAGGQPIFFTAQNRTARAPLTVQKSSVPPGTLEKIDPDGSQAGRA